MKHTFILLTLLLLAFSYRAEAQRFEVGVRLMPTFSSFGLKNAAGNIEKGDIKLGYGGGVVLGYNFSNHLGAQAELLVSSIAQKYQEDGIERKVNLRYVQIPVLLSFNTGKANLINLNIVAGPQIGINAGSRLTTSEGEGSGDRRAILALKKNDVGFAYGAGLDFGLTPSRRTRVTVGYRGVLGLVNIRDKNVAIDENSYYILDRERINTNAAYVGLSFLF